MTDEQVNPIRLRIEGPLACFRRAEMQIDIVSHEVLPPLTAQRIVRAAMLHDSGFSVDAITVLNPIIFVEHQIETPNGRRRVVALSDVAYVLEIGVPRLRQDGPTTPVFADAPTPITLGLSEFLGTLAVVAPSDAVISSLVGRQSLGWLPLERCNHAPVHATRYVNATMIDGCINLRNLAATDKAQ